MSGSVLPANDYKKRNCIQIKAAAKISAKQKSEIPSFAALCKGVNLVRNVQESSASFNCCGKLNILFGEKYIVLENISKKERLVKGVECIVLGLVFRDNKSYEDVVKTEKCYLGDQSFTIPYVVASDVDSLIVEFLDEPMKSINYSQFLSSLHGKTGIYRLRTNKNYSTVANLSQKINVKLGNDIQTLILNSISNNFL